MKTCQYDWGKMKESPLTIRKPSPLSRAGETPQIQHPAHGQIEKPSRILRHAQLCEIRRVVGCQLALRHIWIRGREVVVVVSGEPGVHGAGGYEADVDGDGSGDADLKAACCAHWICGVEDFSGGLGVSGAIRRERYEWNGRVLLVVGVENASHAWSWGVAVEEGIGSFPAVAI